MAKIKTKYWRIPASIESGYQRRERKGAENVEFFEINTFALSAPLRPLRLFQRN